MKGVLHCGALKNTHWITLACAASFIVQTMTTAMVLSQTRWKKGQTFEVLFQFDKKLWVAW